MTEISVIVATSDRAPGPRRCLDALSRQTAAPDCYEVVVVGWHSRGGGSELLAAHTAPFRLRVADCESRGQAAALNRGVAMATGTYCLFLGDDVVADPGLVEEHLDGQRRLDGALCLGKLRLRAQRTGDGLVRYFTERCEERYRRLDSGERDPDFWSCHVGNLSAPTSAVRQAGGFDEDMGLSEDIELAYRLERAGLRAVYLPEAGGEQHTDVALRGVVGEFDRRGAAAATLWRRHPELARYAPLGDFSGGWLPAVQARRLLLAVRAPVWPLALAGGLFGRRNPARLYRFVRLYCFWRGVRKVLDDRGAWRRLTRGTVILMYHAIGQPGEPASRFVVPAGRFRRQLAWLRLRRAPVLTLDEYVGYRKENQLPPAGAVLITFDDGYIDTGEVAAPMLSREGMSATVFVVTGVVGSENRWEDASPLGGRRLLTWGALRELRDRGMAMGAHTTSHPLLPELSEERIESELVQSRMRLERELDMPIRHFAYPHGRTSPEVTEQVRAAGFASACGVQPGANGPAVPVHELRRIEVRGTHSVVRFAMELWLGRPLHSALRSADSRRRST